MIDKVTEPTKIVTDDAVLRECTRQGIDKDYVEFSKDYAPRSLGKEHSPYAKFYRDLKSNKRFMVVSGLPMVEVEGKKIEVGWLYAKGKYYSKANLFSAIVKDKKVTLTCLSDQPYGARKGDQAIWEPQLFLNNVEQTCGKVTLLDIDPVNENYHENVLEWDYSICKRRIRIIEGRFRERWIFETNPGVEVRIKHNMIGAFPLKLGTADHETGLPINVKVTGDEEIIPLVELNKVSFPLKVGASATFYPDADAETSSVDGHVMYYDGGVGAAWETIRNHAGNDSSDIAESGGIYFISDDESGKWQYIRRAIILFDTSALGAGAIVSAATASFYGKSPNSAYVVTDTNLYGSTPNSNTALQASDYGQCGEVALSTRIAHASWNVGTPGVSNDFVLNDLSKIIVDGVSKFSLRDDDNDVANVTPSPFDDSAHAYNQTWFADKGVGYKPKLVVTYTVPGQPYISRVQGVQGMKTIGVNL